MRDQGAIHGTDTATAYTFALAALYCLWGGIGPSWAPDPGHGAQSLLWVAAAFGMAVGNTARPGSDT